MPTFDLKAYENDVLKPMYKKLPYLPDDLLARYAVQPDMPENELRDRVKAVVQHWNKIAMRSGPLSLLCQQLKREHDDRKKTDPKAFDTIDWWKARSKERHEQLKTEITDLAKRLKSSHGELGVITMAQLRLDAAAHGKLGDSELEKACTTAGLTLVEPLALPTVPGMSAPFSTLDTGLLAVGADSVVRLVHPTLTEFGVLGGLTVTPAPSTPESALSEAMLRNRATELDKLPDSTAVRAGKTAVQLLRTELKAGTDLAELSLFHLLVVVREKQAKGVGAGPLFTLLTRTRLRKADAARIAVSVVLEDKVELAPCPACGSKVPAAASCAICGYPIAQHDTFTERLNAAETAFARCDLLGAEQSLKAAEGLWSVPAESDISLAARLTKARELLSQAQAISAKVTSEINQLMSERRYQAALASLRSTTACVLERGRLTATAEQHVGKADQLWLASRAPGLPPERRAQLLKEVLHWCADHKQALEDLFRTPPAPPTNLLADADALSSTVTLSWRPSLEPGLNYIVMRAVGDQPPKSASQNDRQQRLITTTSDRWEDSGPIIGVPLRYAVFANRGGTISDSAAETLEPLFLMGEPEVWGMPGEARVDVSWTLPEGASGVEVARVPGYREGPDKRLVPGEHTKLTDRDVVNGVRYRYTVRAVYQDPAAPDGRRRSAGRQVGLTPHPNPTLPGPVQVQGKRPRFGFYKYEVQLRWLLPDHGTMTIVRFDDTPASLRPGDHLTPEELKRHGDRLFTDGPPVTDSWSKSRGVCSEYVSVHVMHGMAHVGHSRPYAAIDEVGQLSVDRRDTTVRLGWMWPEESDAAVVAYDPTTEPVDVVGAARSLTVAREPHAPTGEVTLDLGGRAGAHVLVAACVNRHDVQYLTTGARRRVPPANRP